MTKLAILSLIILLDSYAALAEPNQCRIDPLQPNATSEFDPKQLERLKSVDEVPGILGDLRNHFAIGYRSHSPQKDDYRVIAYSTKSPYIVAYTGCPIEKADAKGNKISLPYPREVAPLCEQVETMYLKEPEEKLELKAYRLPGKNSASDRVRILGQQDRFE